MELVEDQQLRRGHGGQRSLWPLHPHLSFDGFGLQRFSLASLIASSHRFCEVYYCYEENAIVLRVIGQRRDTFPSHPQLPLMSSAMATAFLHHSARQNVCTQVWQAFWSRSRFFLTCCSPKCATHLWDSAS